METTVTDRETRGTRATGDGASGSFLLARPAAMSRVEGAAMLAGGAARRGRRPGVVRPHGHGPRDGLRAEVPERLRGHAHGAGVGSLSQPQTRWKTRREGR